MPSATTTAAIEGTIVAQDERGRRLLADQIAELEGDFGETSAAVVYRAVFWRSLMLSAKRAGIAKAADLVGPDLVEANAKATDGAVGFARLVAGLDSGRLCIVPYQLGEDPEILLGVGDANLYADQLGFWPIVWAVIRFAAGAALAGSGIYLTNAFLSSQQMRAETEKIQADNEARVLGISEQLAAAGRPKEAAMVAQAVAKARQAAATADTSTVLGKLAGGLQNIGKVAAIGAGGAGILWVLLLLGLVRGPKRQASK